MRWSLKLCCCVSSTLGLVWGHSNKVKFQEGLGLWVFKFHSISALNQIPSELCLVLIFLLIPQAYLRSKKYLLPPGLRSLVKLSSKNWRVLLILPSLETFNQNDVLAYQRTLTYFPAITNQHNPESQSDPQAFVYINYHDVNWKKEKKNWNGTSSPPCFGESSDTNISPLGFNKSRCQNEGEEMYFTILLLYLRRITYPLRRGFACEF